LTSKTYCPREDTLLLLDEALKIQVKRVLEIGVGSGLVTLSLARANRQVVGTEIDEVAIRSAQNLIKESGFHNRVDLVLCRTAEAFRQDTFDAVIFNPPYLPTDEVVDRTVNGGKDGIQVSEIWFQAAAEVAKDNGRIIFLTSSLSNYLVLLRKIGALGFRTQIIRHQHLFFEDLMLIEAVYDGSDKLVSL
jgi:release factor glutamine methyltransferase